ncbi:hypothetical protein [Devosia ginsengisoli]|uniref:hypothetical protein n=1 Tax=Devosia ginsengisoli TaxID=400770 RepID=UPI0026EA32E4|nr:hypothetical protein [Devosia ginsengisoli]MCR6673254.1 hypothetical protein [Devosia ginsengisoli]
MFMPLAISPLIGLGIMVSALLASAALIGCIAMMRGKGNCSGDEDIGSMSAYGRVMCRVCGKIVNGRVPAGGDGSALFPWRHRASGKFGPVCDGSYTEAVGEGIFDEPRLKFGYAHAVEMRAIEATLDPGLDPTAKRFAAIHAYEERHKDDLTLRQAQAKRAAERKASPPSRSWLNAEEIAYLIERLAGVNDPMGLSARSTLRAMQKSLPPL